jgi:signal transduction histidine kinase
LKGRNKQINIRWALFCIFISFWGLGGYKFSTVVSEEEAFFWWKIANIGGICIPIAYYQLIFAILNLKKKYQKSILIVAYILGSIFLIFNFLLPEYFIGDLRLAFNQIFMTGFSYKNPLYLFFYITFYWILLLYSFSLLVISYRKSSGVVLNQLKYFIIASLIGWLGGHSYFLSAIETDIYPYANLLIAIYPIIFAYAILRYSLMDIYLVIKRTAAYSLSAGLLMSFFVVVTLTVTKLLSTYTHVDSFKVSIFAAIVIAILFNPLRNIIQELIDKLFYKKTYDYYGTLRKVSHDLAAMFDLKKIYSFIGDIIFSTLGLKKIYLLSDVSGGGFEPVYTRVFGGKKEADSRHQTTDDRPQATDHRLQTTDGTETEDETLKIDGNSAILKLIKSSDDIVIKDELSQIVDLFGQKTVDNIAATLKVFDAQAMAPVFIDGKLELLLMLGEKQSGDIFTDEDVKLLNTISHQTAISMKNARLYSQKVNSDRLASIGMMSATFAHEIRNPLTSVKTFAQLIPEKFDDAEFRDTFAKIVIDDIGRIDGLIKDLLSFSSKESVPGINTLDVTELVDKVLESQKGRCEFEKNNISLRKKYKDAAINIQGDPQKLKQALINIISNGCQSMQANGVLTVDIIPNSKEVDIKISDTGKGMTSHEIAKIFDPFYTTKTMGVGLGLAISRKIIEDHGGKISVESKLSQGTTFTISLQIEKNSDN